MKEYYKIGEISKLYDIGTDSLRYYEELGLLNPKRDSNGYRLYSLRDISRLNVIRELRTLGFSMERIKSYLDHRTL
ncbi:MAG: MerR family transcriptional regulator, partial [Clostridiales bacterium]